MGGFGEGSAYGAPEDGSMQRSPVSHPIGFQLAQSLHIDLDCGIFIGKQSLVGIAVGSVIAQIHRVTPLLAAAEGKFEIRVGDHRVASEHTRITTFIPRETRRARADVISSR